MSKQNKLTIGIPAYNEEVNIANLLSDILHQKEDGFVIDKIIISSDGSSDKTVSIARSFSDSRIAVVDNVDRRGIARGLNQIIFKAKGDILVTLDADIHIEDEYFLRKLIQPITDGFDHTSSAIRDITAIGNFSKMLSISMKLKEILFKAFNKGNNIYTCHGLARAYSKAFYRNLVFPVSVGNDMYGYLACISGGFKYIYVESVIAYYRLPEDINDHQKQSYRFLKAASQQCGYFGKKMVEKETKIPTIVYLWAGLKALPVIVRNPKDTISYLLMFLRLKNKQESYEVNQAWDMVVTSKNL